MNQASTFVGLLTTLAQRYRELDDRRAWCEEAAALGNGASELGVRTTGTHSPDARIMAANPSNDPEVKRLKRRQHAYVQRLRDMIEAMEVDLGLRPAKPPAKGPGRRRVLVSDGEHADHGDIGNRAAAREQDVA